MATGEFATEILRVLVKHDVEFVVVGGVAAMLNGAPITTADVDILHRRESANIARLVATKDFANRDKHRITLPVLRATLDEREREKK